MNTDTFAENANLFSRLTILVVEDSANMRDLLTALLKTMGIGTIHCAPDGESGLKLFGEIAPDLVITDGMMQPMTGYAMTRAIRKLRAAPGTSGDIAARQGSDVPVLMLSGHDEPDIVEWARNEGVTDYIVKPVTPELLYERVLSAISAPIHVVETKTYRGPSPRRRLIPHGSDLPTPQEH
jgi:CheY-like chemotaxis protein